MTKQSMIDKLRKPIKGKPPVPEDKTQCSHCHIKTDTLIASELPLDVPIRLCPPCHATYINSEQYTWTTRYNAERDYDGY